MLRRLPSVAVLFLVCTVGLVALQPPEPALPVLALPEPKPGGALVIGEKVGQTTGGKKGYPATKKDAVTDKLHGQDIADPYRWLEQQDAPAVKEWIAAQNAFTRTFLDAQPGRDRLYRRFAQLSRIGTLTAPVMAGGRLFYLKRSGDQDQAVLYVREGLAGRDRVLINPNALDGKGLTAIDWFYPSPNGRYLAFGTSSGGTELSTLQIADVGEWKFRPDKIERTRACSVAWLPDGTGFYYTRYPAAGSVPKGEESYHRHVYFHKLGDDPKNDAKVFGEGRDKEEWINLNISPNGQWLLITVQLGWSKSLLFLKDTKTAEPAKSLEVKDFLHEAILDDERLYIRTNDEAPRFKLMVAELAKPTRADWKDLVPQAESGSLQDLARVGKRLALNYLESATSRLAIYTTQGKETAPVQLPPLGSITGFGGDENGTDLFVAYANFLMPTSVYHIGNGNQVDLWQQLTAPDFDASAFQVNQVQVESKDKTKVPVFIIHKNGVAKNGQNPTLLYGYGGFNVNITPSFSAAFVQFLEKGGVVAVANLRGGGEFGEDWHKAGMLGNKQNVFDDFLATAEWLIAQKYTSADKLAIQGGSNGGLLVAAAATQKPELFRAVVCQVPLTDMIRYVQFGLARLWVAEYGDPAKADEFAWLAKYSPYHNVKDGAKFPAMLITAAAGDSRVDPLHACKLAARIQAATTSDRPILLRLETQAGHGAGKSRRQTIMEQTDIWSFLYSQLGVEP